MPHRPLFVLRCHHFSPVIYFIAISVSLPPSPSPSPPSLQCLSSFFTCALPPPPPCPLGRSFFLPHPPLIHPAAHRAYEHLARNSPLHNATQFHSPHPPGDFIIRFCLRLVLTPSLSQSRLWLPLLVFSFARVAAHRRYFDDDAECKKERKSRRGREREERARDRAVERLRVTGKRSRGGEREKERGETALSTARRVQRGEQYNCI